MLAALEHLSLKANNLSNNQNRLSESTKPAQCFSSLKIKNAIAKDTLSFGAKHIYPEQKPTKKDGFYKAKLNRFRNLKHQGNNQLGKTAYVEYIDENKNKKTAIGTITRSFHAVLGITNLNTGRTVTINTNYDKILEAWLKPQAEKLEDLMLKADKPSQFLEEKADSELYDLSHYPKSFVYESISKHPQAFGVIKVNTEAGPFVLTGKVSIVEHMPGYSVIQLETKSGEKYLIDLDFVKAHIAIDTENNKKFDQFDIKNGKPVNILDPGRLKKAPIMEKLLAEIYENKKSPYETKALYDFLSSDIEYTRSLIDKWYGKETSEKLVSSVKRHLGEKHIVLLGDPGVASRVKELIKYAKDENLDTASLTPLKLRQLFAKHLGTSKIYRGMAITDEEAKTIKEEGLLAPGLLKKEKTVKALHDIFDISSLRSKDDINSRGYYVDEIVDRIQHGSEECDNIYSSCSKFKEVASTIGWYEQMGEKKDVHPYLIELKIPAISIIEQNGIFNTENLTTLEERIGKRFSIGTDKIYKTSDPDVEKFVPFVVRPAHLKIKKTDIPLYYFGDKEENFKKALIWQDGNLVERSDK